MNNENEDFNFFFLLGVRKAFHGFCKHGCFFVSVWFLNVSVFTLFPALSSSMQETHGASTECPEKSIFYR